MASCNLSLVLHAPLRMELEQRPQPPPPGPHQVQLATQTVGICGSDVKYWRDGKIGAFVLDAPMVLGHETSALVERVGEQVSHLSPGDRVAVEVGVPCARCQLCRAGRYNLCAEMVFAATPPHDGTLCRRFNHPADLCFRLPGQVSLEEGALLEPLAVAVHASRRAPIRPGQVVLVCGAGAVGLLSMLVARAFGARQVIVTDVNARRLELAAELGAAASVQVLPGAPAAELARQVAQHAARLRGQPGGVAGVDVVLECSGAEASLALAIEAARAGGQVVCVGCQPDKVTLPLNSAAMREVDIKGVFRYRNCYPLALALVESGQVDLRRLVTHRFPLEQAHQAFETCWRGEGVKIVIECGQQPPAASQ